MKETPKNEERRRYWIRSVGFKMTVSAAVVIMLFGWLRPVVTRWAFQMFRLQHPTVERPVDQMIEILRDPSLWDACSPSAEPLRKFFEYRLGEDQLAALIDCRGRVVAHALESTDFDASAIPIASRFRVLRADGTPGVGNADYLPLWGDGELLGYEVSVRLLFNGQGESFRHAKGPILPLPMDHLVEVPSQARARLARFDRIRAIASVAITACIALLLGMFVTVVVTRRLGKLVRQVERSELDDLGRPDAFRVSGNDEITLLAGALNGMRERIGELVTTLKQRDVARREWVAQVSHDIRTPLTSLSLCLDRARDDLVHGERESIDEHLDLARHDLRRMSSFVDDLFEIARLEISDELLLESIVPQELIEDAARSIRPQAERSGILLELEGDQDAPEFLGDGHRLMRAFENLLSNAVRYAKRQVTFRVLADGDEIAFAVIDDGAGFSGDVGPVDLAQVQSQRQRTGSLGLGLLVAQRVAEAHGGSIEAENGEGWTRVQIRIPLRI